MPFNWNEYPAALAADEAWSEEGRRIFGARWGDVRYTERALGAPGTELRRRYDAYKTATDRLHATSAT